MTPQEIIAKYLMRGTGMDEEVAMVRALHLLDDFGRENYRVIKFNRSQRPDLQYQADPGGE